MERIGEVTAVKGEWLEVTFCRQTDCGHCHACNGTKKNATIRVFGKANVGDAALVAMPAATVTMASMIAYLIPLVCTMGGMFIGGAVGGGDVGGAIGALVGLGVGIGIIAVTENQRKKDPRWTPVLKEVIPHYEGVKIDGNRSE